MQTISEAHPSSWSVSSRELPAEDLKLATQLHLMPRLRMGGAIPLAPYAFLECTRTSVPLFTWISGFSGLKYIFRINLDVLTQVIIIIIIIISFMQGIYTYIPETNYVPREYSVAAILLFLFMVLISLLAVLNLLYFYISTFRSMCVLLLLLLLLLYHHHHHHLLYAGYLYSYSWDKLCP